MKTELKIDGMMCINCQNNVTKALEAVVEVSKATVNWETGIAVVELNAPCSDETLRAAVENMASKRDFTVTGITAIR